MLWHKIHYLPKLQVHGLPGNRRELHPSACPSERGRSTATLAEALSADTMSFSPFRSVMIVLKTWLTDRKITRMAAVMLRFMLRCQDAKAMEFERLCGVGFRRKLIESRQVCRLDELDKMIGWQTNHQQSRPRFISVDDLLSWWLSDSSRPSAPETRCCVCSHRLLQLQIMIALNVWTPLCFGWWGSYLWPRMSVFLWTLGLRLHHIHRLLSTMFPITDKQIVTPEAFLWIFRW